MASKAKGGGKPPAKNGKAPHDNDDFDQGPDGARKQRAAGVGHNSGEFKVDRDAADQIAEYLEKVERVDADVAKIEKEISLRNEPMRKKIKDLKKSLKGARDTLVKDGIAPTEELDTLTRKRRLLKKAADADENLSPEQAERFQKIEDALGAFGDTDLGRAAIAREHAPAR